VQSTGRRRGRSAGLASRHADACKTLVALSTMASIPCSQGFEAIVLINGHVLQDRYAATIVVGWLAVDEHV